GWSRAGGPSEDLLELLALAGNGGDGRGDLGHIGVHLDGPGGGDLALERRGAAIPVPRLEVGDVVERGGMARVPHAARPHREHLAVRPALFPDVTRLARSGAVPREALVEEELLPEGDLLRRRGVVGGGGWGGGVRHPWGGRDGGPGPRRAAGG